MAICRLTADSALLYAARLKKMRGVIEGEMDAAPNNPVFN
jgi:hypothetical protein